MVPIAKLSDHYGSPKHMYIFLLLRDSRQETTEARPLHFDTVGSVPFRWQGTYNRSISKWTEGGQVYRWFLQHEKDVPVGHSYRRDKRQRGEREGREGPLAWGIAYFL